MEPVQLLALRRFAKAWLALDLDTAVDTDVSFDRALPSKFYMNSLCRPLPAVSRVWRPSA